MEGWHSSIGSEDAEEGRVEGELLLDFIEDHCVFVVLADKEGLEQRMLFVDEQ